MIAALIMAAWFGYRAHKVGKNPVLWTVLGLLILLAIQFGLGFVAGGMFGPYRSFEAVITVTIAVALVSIVIAVLIGRQILVSDANAAAQAEARLKNSKLPCAVCGQVGGEHGSDRGVGPMCQTCYTKKYNNA